MERDTVWLTGRMLKGTHVERYMYIPLVSKGSEKRRQGISVHFILRLTKGKKYIRSRKKKYIRSVRRRCRRRRCRRR